ncbi:MAG TPA: ABC transporter permease [Pedobacter sp.]
MYKNYLKTAIRNLFKHKVFSLVNIFGLAIGIAACLVILQYVRFEWSYDNYHQNADRIYRIQQNRYNDGKLGSQWAAGSPAIGPSLINDLPEIESFARLQQTGGIVSYNEKEFREDKVFAANESFLSMFSYTVLKGQLKGALAEPFTAVITQGAAKKYFGKENPIGKFISYNETNKFRITAVVADVPVNSHLKFEFLFSFATIVKFNKIFDNAWDEDLWNTDGYYTYLLLKPGTNPEAFEKKIAKLVEYKRGAIMKKRSEGIELKLQPLKTIHLDSNYMLEAEVNGNGQSVNFLLIVAIFIIIIAWINYINLSTARAVERAKEVGIRKVVGSARIQLISQFMLESLLINLIAGVLAFIILASCWPLFNSFIEKEISLTLLSDVNLWIGLVSIFIIGTILSGLYPAFVLSSFRPIEVLKGNSGKNGRGAWLRQSLVVIQFAASVALMVGTFSVYRQLDFMQNQDLGVDIEQTLVLNGPAVRDSSYSSKFKSFKAELIKVPGITGLTTSTSVPGQKVDWNAGGIKLVGADPTTDKQYRIQGIDYDYVDFYGLTILKGRNFSEKHRTDPKAVLFNEAAIKLLGYKNPEDALNKKIDFWDEQYTIIGVVKNYHQESLKQAYDANIFRLQPENSGYYSVKIQAGTKGINKLIKLTENKWASFFAGNPFEYFFLDEHFQQQYKADEQFGRTFTLFSVLAIIVASLGLFGLVSFVTTKRTKEISIRKISGAGTFNILVLLTKDFIKPILISFLIATPVTYYLLGRWLSDYAFRIDLSAWMFVLPGLFILCLALLTISIQTVKAANANPVRNLRAE